MMPLDAAPVGAYPGAHAYPVVRVSATTPGAGAAVLSPTVLGLPREAIRRLHWRSDFSPLSTTAIARKLTAQGEPRQAGIALPAGRRERCRRQPACAAPGSSRRSCSSDHRRLSLVRLGVAPRRTRRRCRRDCPTARTLRVLGIELALPNG